MRSVIGSRQDRDNIATAMVSLRDGSHSDQTPIQWWMLAIIQAIVVLEDTKNPILFGTFELRALSQL
jgi:hypothetical protein